MKRWRALGFVAVCLLAGAWAFAPRADLVLYNHSPSVPIGLYVRQDAEAARGVYVTVRASAVAPEAARAHAFTDAGDRFIKRVAAVAGDEVCADADHLYINGAAVAARAGELPLWRGCRPLHAGEILLMGDNDQSFDGRYWGPTRTDLIEGVWRKLDAPFGV
ncbi:MAG TPA: S26 family signal peptidase [Verrucomicrobiae bacterium]|nr:S26 family signal peptidase [Verrucomicrobiae bacterium]